MTVERTPGATPVTRSGESRESPVSAAALPSPVGEATVEAVVRRQLGTALGGRRGMLEAAVPTGAFTLSWITSHQLGLSLAISAGTAVLLLVLRILQRSTPQFVLNSLVGIGVAAVVALRSGRAEDVFLPGIIYSAGAAVLLIISISVRWPVVGLLIGAVSGDPVAWRRDPAIVRLCTKLTWILVLPNLIRLAVQWPLYLAGNVALLGATKIILGWPLFVAALAAMLWVLARGHTPLDQQARARAAGT